MQDLKVITSQERISPFNRAKIAQALIRETQELAPRFFNKPGLTQSEAESVALSAEKTLRTMPYPWLTAPLIREVVNAELLLRGHIIHRNILSRVGTPIYDACMMDVGKGKEDKENANLQDNAETSHKKKADRMSKEQYLLLLPPQLSQRHLEGDLHIHDLEYFGTRPFCQDHDLRYFFYYGLMPDGKGQKAAVAGPAKRPEVAILHAVKALGSAQTNFAGGQGYYNFLTFVAPYLEKLPYSSKDPKIMSIKQLMQMFVYEMTQMMVARGGQLVFSSVQLTPGVPKVWKNRPVVAYGKIFDGVHEERKWTYGELEPVVRLAFKALMEVFLEGDAWGKPFSFPKPEIVLSNEFMSDPQAEYWKDHQYYGMRVPTREELYILVTKLAIIYGSPYFDNEIPEYRNADGEGITCYQCCSYQFAARPEDDPLFNAKMDFENGQHFSMGGYQVVTGNMPRAAMRAKEILKDFAIPSDLKEKITLQAFMQEVKGLMNSAVEIFQQKKVWMDQALAADRIPFATQTPRDPYSGKAGQPLVDFSQLVFAFGIVGMNEVSKILTGHELGDYEEGGWDFSMKAVYLMKQYCQELSQKHGIHMVLARTPAETVAQRFAALDLDSEFKEMALQVVNGNKEEALKLLPQTLDVPVYYTNGAMIKMSTPRTVKFQVEREGQFFPLVDGGNIMHLFVDDVFPLVSAHFDRQAELQQRVREYREAGDQKTARHYEKEIIKGKTEDRLLTSWASDLWEVIKNIAITSDVGYFAFTRDISICLDCASTIKGRVKKCPVCGSSEVDVITRVTGYCQAVSGFNRAKKQEVEDRYRHNSESFGMKVVG